MSRCCILLRGDPGATLVARAKAALDAGLAGVSLEAPLHVRHWEALRAEIPRESVLAVQLFLPYPREVREGQPCALQLGSLHPEDRRDALRHGTETILFAADREIPIVRIDPIPVGDARPSERPLLRARRLDSFKITLEKLLEEADRRGRTIAVSLGVSPDELPGPEDFAALQAELAGAPLAAFAESRWLAARAQPGAGAAGADPPPLPPLAGALLRDTDGHGRVVPLGTGATPWGELRPRLEAIPLWLADVDPTGWDFNLDPALRAIGRLMSTPEAGVKPRFCLY